MIYGLFSAYPFNFSRTVLLKWLFGASNGAFRRAGRRLAGASSALGVSADFVYGWMRFLFQKPLVQRLFLLESER